MAWSTFENCRIFANYLCLHEPAYHNISSTHFSDHQSSNTTILFSSSICMYTPTYIRWRVWLSHSLYLPYDLEYGTFFKSRAHPLLVVFHWSATGSRPDFGGSMYSGRFTAACGVLVFHLASRLAICSALIVPSGASWGDIMREGRPRGRTSPEPKKGGECRYQ